MLSNRFVLFEMKMFSCKASRQVTAAMSGEERRKPHEQAWDAHAGTTAAEQDRR
jgi:hypothetical protein